MLTIHEAAEAIRAKRLTPIDLLDQCLDNIAKHEERVRAWVFVAREEAREQAKALTKEFERGQYRGPLHGIPIGVKDIFDVFDWPTAAGSKLWAKSVARKDSTAVERLRQAGAVFVGKTHTTAYASFDPSPTCNPWQVKCTPGGSSSGSAAAVACGMCLGALASQTGGSITRPASFCGVSAIKPTYGRIAVDGVVALAPSMDHVGVMTNSVRDIAILMGTLSDPTPQFSAHLAATPAERQPTLAKLGGLFAERASPEMRSAMAAAVSKLHEAGASIVDVDPPAVFANVLDMHHIIMAVEAAEVHEQRIKRHPEDYPPRITSLIQQGFATSATEYVRSLHNKDVLTDALTEQLQIGVAPAFLCPATMGVAPPADTTGDPAFNSPWSYTGLPVVSVPIGWSPDGLPLCAQIIGDRFSEEELLRLAVWCEDAIKFERREMQL
jgi:Asp-tRNA(Asn)/Glu-tRNA(Gln) amidotransferase A subunit family amidase